MLRPITLSLLPLLALSACDFEAALQALFGDLAEPVILVGVAVEVVLDDGTDALAKRFDLATGPAFVGALAHTASLRDGSVEHVAGAALYVDGIPAEALGDGAFALEDDDELAYRAGKTWLIEAALGDRVGQAVIELPEAASWTAPGLHEVGAPLVVDLDGQAFDGVLVSVMEVMSGEIVWSNYPTTAEAALDLVVEVSEALVVEVPAEVFAEAGDYVVAVGGAITTRAVAFDGLNSAFSRVASGRVVLHHVVAVQGL